MLLIGYGNPARGDDGLGPMFVERIIGLRLDGITCLTDYQLTVDHARLVADSHSVVFADAVDGVGVPFSFAPLVLGNFGGLMSHSLTPEGVLALAHSLYDRAGEVHVLGIAGYDFDEVREGLSPGALENLERAVCFFETWYRGPAAASGR